ncbi:radical SAM protein [Alkaliphilus pronyensis]|uniref:Radical SAM protein n=1 Tax=Alkaliphilus pronyensis TaxID=1482732 RepID=A0A6I0FIC5_9FIRM|nr:radical SAM protein [Alkaliphilus pronyensis]KAB3538529.1 radical SAM protein [Alkaliphilus pronyensis]
MNIRNLPILSKMAVDTNVIKSLYEVHNLFKEDENFNVKKYIKMISSFLEGEKVIKFEDKYIISTFIPPFPSKAFIQNAKAVNNPEDIFTQQIYGKRSAPISIYLCLTHKCPNRCIYCSSKNRLNEEELTTNEWINVINDLQDMKTPIIGLTGGEPMVRDDIYEIVKSIDERSISTLFTSGVNFTLEKAKELKKNGLFSIGISLDSHNKENHNKNRSDNKAFDYAINAIQNSRNAGLYTMAQTVILKENLSEEDLFKLFKLAGENGAHEVKILEPILSGDLLNRENLSNILYSKKDREKLVEIQHKANKISKFPKITTFAYTESQEKFGCGAGTQHSYISATGSLYPCDFVPMDFGNVKAKSIKELWKEMNEVVGIPKIECFAQKINGLVYEKSNGNLPLNKLDSIEICKKNKNEVFPKY